MSIDRIRPGEHIAPGYRVLGLLRQGEDVAVYDAWSEERDCRCVVKTLRPDRRNDRGSRARLLNEGDRLLALAHPHIVRAYEVRHRPTPLVALETLSGDTLGHMIEGPGPRLPTSDLCALTIQLASALTYLHRNGLLHLDVKPSNIICQLDQAKLIDLGIAQPPGPGRAGVGTALYMAPEQFTGGHLDAATDVWGLGAVLYEAASRVRPLNGGASLASAPIAPLRTHRRLPLDLATAIDACLAPDPSDRPTLDELGDAARRVM